MILFVNLPPRSSFSNSDMSLHKLRTFSDTRCIGQNDGPQGWSPEDFSAPLNMLGYIAKGVKVADGTNAANYLMLK